MEGTSAFGALSKMGEGPPKSVCRRRLQTATSCWGDSAPVVSVAGKGAARPRQVRSVELNVSEPLMTCRDDLHGVETGGECGPREKVGAPTPGTCVVPHWHPAWRRQERGSGFDEEQENPASRCEGSGASGGNRKCLSTDAGHGGRGVRSRAEGSVMELDRRHAVDQLLLGTQLEAFEARG